MVDDGFLISNRAKKIGIGGKRRRIGGKRRMNRRITLGQGAGVKQEGDMNYTDGHEREEGREKELNRRERRARRGNRE